MIQRLSLATLLLILATPVWSLDARVFGDVSIYQVASGVGSTANAQYQNSNGENGPGEIWGQHWIEGSRYHDVWTLESYDTLSGNWGGSISIHADPSLCFRAKHNAYTRANLFQIDAEGFGSVEMCIPVPTSPPVPPVEISVSQDPLEPLIIDLNGDGIQTTGADDMVWFDLDGNGVRDHLTWTNPHTHEGFLWVNLFGKNRVDNGSELFGIGTVMPDGSKAPDGFTALAIYDRPAQGGNGDGIIDARDAVWPKLRVWVDTNHNGVCDPGEVFPLVAYNVDGISLATIAVNTLDAAGNLHGRRSVCWRRNSHRREPLDIESITFRGTLH